MYAGDFNWENCVMCNCALIKLGGEILLAILTGIVGSFVYAWIEAERKKGRDRKKFSLIASKIAFDWEAFRLDASRQSCGRVNIKYIRENILEYTYKEHAGNVYHGRLYLLDESSGKMTFNYLAHNYAGQTFIFIKTDVENGKVVDSIYKMRAPEFGINGNELWLRDKS